MERSKTIHWQDPRAGAQQAQQMDGVAYLQGMLDGTIASSPLVNTLDFIPLSFEKGTATFSFRPQEFHYNPIGSVHGGVVSAILDSAMGCSIHSMLPAGTGYTTLELKVNFLKAVTAECGALKATGKIIYSGNRTALAEAQLKDDNGTLYAHAVSTCMIFKH